MNAPQDPRELVRQVLAGPEAQEYRQQVMRALSSAKFHGPTFNVMSDNGWEVKPFRWWKRIIEVTYMNGADIFVDVENLPPLYKRWSEMKKHLDLVIEDYNIKTKMLDDWKLYISRQYRPDVGKNFMISRRSMQDIGILDESYLDIGQYPYTKLQTKVLTNVIDPFKKRYKAGLLRALPKSGKYDENFYDALQEYATGPARVEQYELNRAKAAFDIATQNRLKLKSVGPFGTNYAVTNLPYDIIRKFHGPGVAAEPIQFGDPSYYSDDPDP